MPTQLPSIFKWISRSSTLQERRLTAEVAERIAAPQRLNESHLLLQMDGLSKMVHRGTGGLRE